ncbi:D-arabinono-1,4-lactone oxidase [Seiridium cupressi]
MAYRNLPAAKLIQKLDNAPENGALVEEMRLRIIDPSMNKELFKEIKTFKDDTLQKAPIHIQVTEHFRPNQWQNCIGEQKCFPEDLRKPQGISDLLNAIQDAQGQKIQARAVGSGHSFSNICSTNGILLDPHGMNEILTIAPATLKKPSTVESLVFVESGITIKSLNDQLDNMGKALANMGAYDGQTLAGAISTGTHGSGIALGNIASLVRAIVFVTENGTVYQIEPMDGITDPARFVPGIAQKLKQDDDWFNAALVAMGCLGLIHSYILEVVPSFLLSEQRTLTTWQDFKSELAGGISSSPLSNHYFEMDINPYVTLGKNIAVTTVRNVPPAGTASGGGRGWENWLAGLISELPWAEEVLVWAMNRWPSISPGTITRALNTLPDTGYVGKSFEVLNIGAVDKVKAYAMELSFDASQDIVATVDRILDTFKKAADDREWYLAGPVALRFVKASSAFLAPQEGRPTMMVEMDMLYGIKSGNQLLKYVRQQLCSGGAGKGVRVHWGLDLDTVQKDDLATMYPQSSKWLAIYKQLNSTGIWNSPFTDRLGITMPM